MAFVALPFSPEAPKAPVSDRRDPVVRLALTCPQHPRRAERDRSPSARSRLSELLATAILGAVSVICLLPIAWMYLTSFRPPNDLFAGVLSTRTSVSNYRSALDSLPFVHLVLNTLAMAIGVSFGQLLTSLLAAYAFTRWRFRGERVLFFGFVATWLVPFQVTMLPNYVLLAHLGLLNAVAGVIIPQLSSAFGLLLLRQHLKSFPTDLLDAADVDGQSSWSTLWRVVVPNLGPALAALTILLFVNAWNEYFWPLLVFHTPTSVLQIGISNFLNTAGTNYGALMAASGLATLPILVLYLVLQRRVVNAFVRSGLR